MQLFSHADRAAFIFTDMNNCESMTGSVSLDVSLKENTGENDMRTEYDFTGGVRGWHYRAMQAGYTITFHKADGTTVTREVTPKKGAVILDPDIQAYFPNSESVNSRRVGNRMIQQVFIAK